MFFRREKAHVPDFDQQLQTLAKAGINASKKSADSAAVMRGACAAVIRRKSATDFVIDPAGIVIGNEIGELVDGGNQKYWLTKSGRKEAAQAVQLQDLHAFTEDLREALGLTSFYNEGLGTVNALHLYDRVEDRDAGVPRRPWEKASV